ncbi:MULTISPECIES: alpha-L-rhamnosidase-related protein [Clostridium]|uniref:Alpha-L-rhamnosidase C-terminal domain-containing protein n=1 Tax=Clostridium frigoriphilum TaxID=443253 RepID=A0ABU7UWS8_9CLOT|nr:hypothetical protein [Clostridium sp. DSM 17811]
MEEQSRKWKSKFIWRDHGKKRNFNAENEVVYFRKVFEIEDIGCRFLAHISADSRYRMYLNGEPVAVGPCKGNGFSFYYETVDLSDRLRVGKNIIAVKVLHHPPIGENISVWRSPLGMLVFDGELTDSNGTKLENIVSDDSWVCLKDESIRFVEGRYNTMFLGGAERVEGESCNFEWEKLEYDDNHWERCICYDSLDISTGVLNTWQLTKRTIPMLYEERKEFVGIKYVNDEEIKKADILEKFSSTNKGCLKLDSGKRFIVEIDAGILTTGYIKIRLSGGKDSKIKILCAECYENEPIEIPWTRDRGVRDDEKKGKLYGDIDIYKVSGRGNKDENIFESYEPFWFRTFRFIRIEITVGESPLYIHSFNYRETGYPLEVKAEFQCSDVSLHKLWDISINTLRRCMHETYEDCPYYEQFQYTMDTYLQTLFTYHVSGDDRLARKAIYDFHSSLLPQGLLQSRYPSIEPQIIPAFNFYWILMLHDHYSYFRDSKLVKRYRATMDTVLEWFDRRLNEEGLVDNIPDQYWKFVDWVPEWRSSRGVPQAAKTGSLTVYSLMYAVSLQKAAELNIVVGRKGIAQEYLERATKVNHAVIKNCWSEENKMFRDGPAVELYSQHAQIWAVLSGAIEGKKASNLMEVATKIKTIAQVSYAMSYFLFRALSKTGLYDKSFELWDAWREMTNLNVTTWNEDPVTQRSECHAWGAVHLYEFCAEILGVKPSEGNADSVTIDPKLGPLTWAKGKVVTRLGEIGVSWKLLNGNFNIGIYNPNKANIDMYLPDGTIIKNLCDKVIQLKSKLN